MDRKNNAVFYNTEETDGIGENQTERDKKMLVDVGNEIGVDLEGEDILSMRRTGKEDQVRKVQGREIKVPRLLLVTFTEQVKAQVLRRKYKLKSSDSDVMQRV